jgi:hypothetical protein
VISFPRFHSDHIQQVALFKESYFFNLFQHCTGI